MYPLSAGLVIESKELWIELKSAIDTLPVGISFELPEIPADWDSFLRRIENVRPDVVLIEVTKLTEPIEDVIKRIRSTSAQPAVFALHTSAQPDAILGALRAGASEFLYPPVAGPLKQALERLGESRQRAHSKLVRNGKTIGVLSAKGGCGATTVACHVAVELGRLVGTKVLLADLDLQAGLIGFLLKTKSTYSVADAVNNLRRLDPSYWQGLISNGIPNLEIIAAPTSMAAKQLPAAQLKQMVAFTRTQYEWSVLDLGRNLNPATLSMLELIDETYLVTTQEIPALHQVKQILQTLIEAGYPSSQVKLVLNRSTKRLDVTIEELESMLGVPVHTTLGEDGDALHEAYSTGKLLDDSSALGRDLGRLAGRIAGVPEVKKRKFSFFG